MVVNVHAMPADQAGIHRELLPGVPVLTCVSDWFGGCLLGWGCNDGATDPAPAPRTCRC